MNSCNFRNKKFKVGWTGMAQSGQKRIIFIVVPQLRMEYGSGFVRKDYSNNNNKDSNNDNATEAQKNHSDSYFCLLVQVQFFHIMFENAQIIGVFVGFGLITPQREANVW